MEMYKQMDILRHRSEVRKSNLSYEVKDVALQNLAGFKTFPNQLSSASMSGRDEAFQSFLNAKSDSEFVREVVGYHMRIAEKIIRMAEEWEDLLSEIDSE